MSSYRVSQNEVRAIIDSDVVDLLPFIAIADELTTEKLSGKGLSTTLLKEITRWLSAHFVAIRDPRTTEEKTGEAAAKFFLGKVGTGLDATPYGQQVKILDVTGTLNSMGKRASEVVTIA